MISFAGPARWLASALLVGSAHAAALTLMVRTPDLPLEEEASGAFVVELAPIVAAAPAPLLELPPGPPSIDSIEAPQITATRKSEPPPEPELPLLPVPPAAPPAIALPAPVEKPLEEPKRAEKVEHQQAVAPQAVSVASRATAPLRIEEADTADRPAAPALGTAERERRTRAEWQGALSAHLMRHARFPPALRALARDVQVLVRFRIDRRGHVVSTAVAAGSGSEQLDAEAEAMIRRASPLPVPPEQVTSEALDLVVPVRFKARR